MICNSSKTGNWSVFLCYSSFSSVSSTSFLTFTLLLVHRKSRVSRNLRKQSKRCHSFCKETALLSREEEQQKGEDEKEKRWDKKGRKKKRWRKRRKKRKNQIGEGGRRREGGKRGGAKTAKLVKWLTFFTCIPSRFWCFNYSMKACVVEAKSVFLIASIALKLWAKILPSELPHVMSVFVFTFTVQAGSEEHLPFISKFKM